jgi:small subunit ribosomal protein S8e
MPVHKKKRLFEMGRPTTMTKLGPKKVTIVKGRGGNLKHRALRIDAGTFSWGSEAISKKTRVLDVVYNSTNNELVRTKTLVKNCIVRIDAGPFRQWYLQHYDIELNKKKLEETDKARAGTKRSSHVKAKLAARKPAKLEQKIADQFNQNNLLACISSRPGQSGRLDGYVLEGKELDFYVKKLSSKKK